MADIKTRKKGNTTIKTLDRTAIIQSKIKENIINVKDKTKEGYETRDNSGQEYAIGKVQKEINSTVYNGTHKANKIGRKSVRKTAENMKEIDKTIFLDFYYSSKSIKDIAKEQKMSEFSVKQRLYRIRNKIKKEVK